MSTEALHLRNLNLYHRGSRQLHQINLRLFAGEICVIRGEPGSSRTLLVRTIAGQADTYDGEILTAGSTASAGDARSNDIYLIGEELKYAHNLPVMENLFLLGQHSADALRGPFLRHRRLMQETEALLAEFDIETTAKALVAPTDRILTWQLELLRAYLSGCSLIVFEPVVDFCQPQDQARIMHVVQALRQKGIAFLITTSLQDLSVFSPDRVAILQNRTILYTCSGSEYASRLAERSLSERSPERGASHVDSSSIRFLFSNVQTERLKHLDFSIHAGEVAGLACYGYSQIREVIRLLRGDLRHYGGSMMAGSKSYRPTDTSDALRERILFFERLFPESSVPLDNLTPADNIAISSMDHVTSGPLISSQVTRFLHHNLADQVGLSQRQMSIPARVPSPVRR